MTLKPRPPVRLYKYRSFSNLTLEMLIGDTLFFADPSNFNDPLDTRPTLEADVDAGELAAMLTTLVEQRTHAEMSAAAKAIKYRGPKTAEHIVKSSSLAASQLIERIRYDATNPDYDFPDPERFLLGKYVERELLQRYDKGIVSLAERAVCPLMWSHYGDQHHGLCIGYSVPDDVLPRIQKMTYGGSRRVPASSVSRMLAGEEGAQAEVDDSVLFRKARDWRYEREWRLLGSQGVQNSPLEMEEVVFGLRCTPAVKYAVVSALDERGRPIRFFEIRENDKGFTLKKRSLDVDELRAGFPRRARTAFESLANYNDSLDDA